VHPEANIIFGAVIDDTLGDEVRVTVIAAGFDGGEPTSKSTVARRTNYVVPETGSATSAAPVAASADDSAEHSADAWRNEPSLVPTAPIDRNFDDDDGDLDIPDFLK
jgi:cell division protein FtsZ